VTSVSYLRKDSSGFVYERYEGSERIIYKLNGLAGDSWTIPNNQFGAGDSLVVTIDTTSFEMSVYHTVPCKRFRFNDPEVEDEELYVTLAPGYGFVSYGSFFGAMLTIKKAKIGEMELDF
jgi:hypothetical protein